MTGLAQVFLFLLLAVLLGLALRSWRVARRAGAVRHASTVLAVRPLASHAHQAQADGALEVLCALPQGWEGHQAGQFVWAGLEGATAWAGGLQPLAIASAPGAATVEGVPLLRLVLRPQGAALRRLCRRLQPGARLQLSGACGTALGPGRADLQQVWVADAAGLAPFMAALEARQQGGAEAGSRPVQLHYCTQDAQRDSGLPTLARLCAQARPPVALVVYDAAQGQRLQASDLTQSGAVEVWFAGPEGLGHRVRQGLGAQGWAHWRFHWTALARQGRPRLAAPAR